MGTPVFKKVDIIRTEPTKGTPAIAATHPTNHPTNHPQLVELQRLGQLAASVHMMVPSMTATATIMAVGIRQAFQHPPEQYEAELTKAIENIKLHLLRARQVLND